MFCFPILLLLASNPVPAAENRQDAAKPGTFCWPMHFAGVVPGISVDSQVVRLLGQGLLRADEDTRYYVDPKRKATLKIVTGTDRIVIEVSLERGINSTLGTPTLRNAISKYFNPHEGFGNWHALSLASTKADVLKNLGPPARKIAENHWVYDSLCTCEIPQSLALYFADETVERVVFSAPDA
jgi:hypothetical protein